MVKLIPRRSYPFIYFICISLRHERVQHPHVEINAVEEPAKEVPHDDDSIYNYHNSRLQMGLLLMNIADAIKEGDGLRLVNCYKFVLLFACLFVVCLFEWFDTQEKGATTL